MKLLLTLAAGAAGGGVALALGLPLPWLLGAMIVTTVLSLAGVRLQPPVASRKLVLVVIGVMLGAAFTPDLVDQIGLWGFSIAAMLVATMVMMVTAVWLGRHLAGYSMATAIYSGAPGGLSAITLMAADSDADLRIVGITHAVRILILLLAIPPVLHLFGSADLQLTASSGAGWLAMPSLDDALLLTLAGALGAGLGRLLRLPNPLLFGPVLLSGALHVSGMTSAEIPPVLTALAQVVIGVSVGVRFQGAPLRTLGVPFAMAVIQAVLLLMMAIAAAWLVAVVTGTSLVAALLAYMPGGAPELSLVALSLNIEPAFVTSHHLLRITVLLLLLPVLQKRWR